MNMIVAPAGRRLSYFPCSYGSSKLLFRGPQRRVRGDYIACLGGSETFGQYLTAPFPDLLEARIGTTCINLGCRDVGIDAYLNSPSLIDIAAMAKCTVIQITGAVNMSNRFYTVDPRRPHRLVRASGRLKALYPEVDFAACDSTMQMLDTLARVCPERLQVVRQEVQTAWVARMTSLVSQIGGRVVLLWLADHAPYSKAEGGTICRDPLFVDRAMLNAVCRQGAECVEIVVTAEEQARGLSRMVYPETEEPAARQALGPVAHDRAAEALATSLADLQPCRPDTM